MWLKKLWHKVSFLGLTEDQEFSHREVVLLNKTVFVGSLVIFPIIPLEVIINGWGLVPYEVFILFLAVITLYFNYKQWYTFAKIYFFVIAISYVLFMGIAVGPGSGNELALVAIFIAPAMLLNEIRSIIILSLLALAAFVGLKFIQDEIPPFLEVPMELKEKFRIIFQISTLTIIFFQVYYFKGINTRFQQLLASKNEEIAEKNKEIVDSINYAQRIQSSYLPPQHVLAHYFEKSFLLFEPKDIVSGDFYWFYTELNEGSASDDKFIVAADCTGHGVPGAIMSVICVNALNEVVVTKKENDTGLILDKVRDQIVTILKGKDQNGRKDGMDIALIRINKKTGRCQYSGANNPLWILRKNAIEIEVIKADKQPVGSFENAFPFTAHEFHLEQGDRIYIFSDGLQDQFGGDKGKKFKAANMKKLFGSIRASAMPQQKELIRNALMDWKGDLEQVDDVVLIGVEF